MKYINFSGLLFMLSICCTKAYAQSPISVSITNPANNMHFFSGSSVVLNASVSDTTSIIQVSFQYSYSNLPESKIFNLGNGSFNNFYYTYTWTNLPVGALNIWANVTDAAGNTQSSAFVSIIVDSTSSTSWQEGGNVFGTTGVLGTNDSNAVIIQTNGQSHVAILPNGNVGIGRTNPLAQLHTSGTVRFDNYPNDSAFSYYLTTDTSGNLLQKPLSSISNSNTGDGSYIFDNGLNQNGNEVSIGGAFGMDAEFYPSENNLSGFYPYGEIFFDNNYGEMYLSSVTGTDTTSSISSLDLYSYGNSFDLNSSRNPPLRKSLIVSGGNYPTADINGYSGYGGSGISLTVTDSLSFNSDNGIQIYSTGMDFNTPVIQLNYFPNDSTRDLILTTDSVGNLVQKPFSSFAAGSSNGGSYLFDNGLVENGTEVSIGGYNGMDAEFYPPELNITGVLATGGISFDNNYGEMYLTSATSFDSSSSNSSLDIYSYGNSFELNSTTLVQSAKIGKKAIRLNPYFADITGYSGTGGAGISLTVEDSLSLNPNNGIQIYSTGMDLNTPGIQLNYFPNDSANDLILTTDSVGNLIQKPFSSFTGDIVAGSPLLFDNGLTQNGNEVSIGGENGLNAVFSGGYWNSIPNQGYLEYGGKGWYIGSVTSNDSLYYDSELGINPRWGFDLYTGFNNTSSASSQISGYAGNDGPGISLTVSDSLNNNNYNNGIQIYDMGVDLNTPVIQFNYFPNDSAKDLILTTDSVGNLVQKPFSSFGNITSTGRWNYSGSSLYDTLDNIGIGTSNPQSRLSVNGTITSKKVVVSQNGWPDYVFDSTYFLLPLNKLKKYIEQNKHLPDMPATADVSKSGIDLGDNQAVLLKKVEELTLYAIEQNRKQEAQQKIIEEQMKMLVEMKNEIEKLKKKTN